jgi:hypothetical protein
MTAFLFVLAVLGILATMTAIVGRRREPEPIYVDYSWRLMQWRREHGGEGGLR